MKQHLDKILYVAKDFIDTTTTWEHYCLLMSKCNYSPLLPAQLRLRCLKTTLRAPH